MPMPIGLKRTTYLGLLALAAGAFSACQEEITAALDGEFIPLERVTVEVSLPFEEFATDLQPWGGYGQAYELQQDIVARAYGGILDSRVLNSWFSYPVAATVRDSTGVFVTDSALTFVGATLVARFDTLSSVLDGPVTLALGAVPSEWDVVTASWEHAVDSVGDRRAWEEAGGGPVIPLSTAIWDPSQGDTVLFELDSAGVNLMADSAEAGKGVRIESLTEGTRLSLVSLVYSLTTRPSTHRDTLVTLSVGSKGRTFIYDPEPSAPESEIRIGGVPAWRSVLTLEMPRTLDGHPELCQRVPCPLTLTTESLISASLVLTSKATPLAYQPRDTLLLDVRPVYEPARLPKSPLGASLAGQAGVKLIPEYFGEDAGSEVTIPLGAYVEALVAANADSELEVPRTVALLSLFEPLSLYFAAFEGPESPNGPKLRLVLTFAEEVGIR